MKIRSLAARQSWVAGLVAAAGVALFSRATAASTAQSRTLAGHVPAVVAHLQPLGRLSATNRLDLAIGLPLRNQAALAGLLRQIYDPASAAYRQYLTPAQFAEQFGPTEQDYQMVRDFAAAHGLAVTQTHSNRVLLEVSGSVADVEQAFQVTLRSYQHPSENRTFFAPDAEPSVPSALPVLDISGLNNYARPHPKYHLRPAGAPAGGLPHFGSAPGGSYMGDDFREAYLPGVALAGSGQTVALVQFDGYYTNDISAYETLTGRTNIPLHNVLLNGFTGIPTGNGGEVEVSLDIEMLVSMAPGLAGITVYEGNPVIFIPDAVLNRIATDDSASQVSCSWGWTGGPSATTDQIFQQMAAQGQSFFNASGDSDAFPPGAVDDPTQFGTPSGSPYITQVGGTTLTTSGPGGKWVSERVWNWGNDVGSSGGVSDFYSTPVWQQGIDMTLNKGSTTGRNIPDVALTADNVFVIADDGLEYPGVGGTSCAAPLWAGLMALVNQKIAQIGKPPLGFINPTVYALGKGPGYAASFHDITLGDNYSSASPGLYPAVAGYDLCTGWGTPDGASLINALAGQFPRNGFLQMSVNPPSGSALVSGTNQPVYITIIDGYEVTNATVTAAISGVTNLTFLDDGVAVDVMAGDGIYSADFQAPAILTNLTMTVSATAPGEIGITNVIHYSLISLPPNDNFAAAIKVPATGAVYFANNRFATLETNEPVHNGNTHDAASLWWSYTPDVSTNILLDTTGSKVDNIIAVYTNSTLAALHKVVSTNSTLTQRKPARVSFGVNAGTAYHIAIASVSSNALGSIQLRVAPGGQPDTTAPQIAITGPQSGLTVSNSLVLVTGTASDSGANASGVNQVSLSVNGGTAYPAAGTAAWTALAKLQDGLNIISAGAVDEAGNVSSTVTIELVYFSQSPGNDFFAGAISLTNNSGTTSVSTVNATREVGEPDHAGIAGGKSVWWNFLAPADGVLQLSTTNSNFDTLLALYTGSAVSQLTPIAANDDAYPGAPGGFSSVTAAVRSNVLYSIAIDGYDGDSGTNAVLTYSFAPAAVFHLTVSAVIGGTTDPGSMDVQSNGTVSVTALPDPGYVFDLWDGGLVSFANPVSVLVRSNLAITPHFRPVGYTDGFESGDFSALNWSAGGNAPWVVQTNVVSAGLYAARSGVIGNSQSSSLLLAGNLAAGTVSFDVRVSSELGWDILSFLVDGVALQNWSGEVGWTTVAFPIANAGPHTLEWRYAKDANNAVGLDAGFIDNLNLPVPARLQAQQLADGTRFIDLLGQSGQSYLLQVSSDLKAWQTLSTNVAVGGYIHILDLGAGTNQARFYRTVQLPP